MKNFVNIGAIAIVGLLLSTAANATVINCTDVLGNTGSGGKNATSSIDYLSGSVSAASCGPFVGNDSNDLTGSAGGYGYDLSADNGADGGWVELDKLDVLTNDDDMFIGTTGGGIITGTGWGGTSGTFSFTDSGFSEYLIALKFDGVYSTYLSDTFATDWGWNTDAEDNGDGTFGDGGFAISHLTVYVRNPTTVPEPASIALMGLGLIGMGAAARRRKQS